MDTTVTSSTRGTKVYENSRAYVLQDETLRIYRAGPRSAGVLVTEYGGNEWTHVSTSHKEPQSKVHWKDLAIELGTSLQISEQARLQALARLEQALKAEGS